MTNNLAENCVRPTTFIESDKLNALFDAQIVIASETFQTTGSFKFRAAFNLALKVPNDEIITASSGNFGQALACACRILGKKCTVVMPANSAQVKVEAVRSYGAAVDLIDTKTVKRAARVEELMRNAPHAYRASAYDDEFVIEGNATLGAEIADFAEDFDFVIAPVGGGGLISGISKGLCAAGNSAVLIGAEPLLANDAARSLREGRIVANEGEPQTLADGARTLSLGEKNWAYIQKGVREIIEVSEENIRQAVKTYFFAVNLKTEPTGAVSLGALLENQERFRAKKICLVVSGGNVDAAVYNSIISAD